MGAALEKDTKNCYFYQDKPPWGSFFCLSEFFPCCLCQLSGAEAEQPGQSGMHPYKSAQSYSESVSVSHTSVHAKNRKNQGRNIMFVLKLLSNLFSTAQSERERLNKVHWKKPLQKNIK